MIVRTIQQVLYSDGRVLARSDGVDDAWLPDIERAATAFGLPNGASAPLCWFTVPLTKTMHAIVRVLERRFYFLLIERACYDVIPDPFTIGERFPAQWNAQQTLPAVEWPDEPLPKRTTAQLNEILKRGDSPFLLGGGQTLVDSGRLLLVRDEPANKQVRELWMLLPDSIRRQTTFTTFGYSNALRFSVFVVPTAPAERLDGYLTEDQARDYPESRYERDLQVAVEMGDQRTLDALLARKSTTEMLRFAAMLLVAMVAMTLLAKFLAG